MTAHTRSPAFYRYLPFALFMGFIGVDEFVRFLSSQGLFTLQPETLYYLYPLKAVTVALLLYLFRNRYHELNIRELSDLPTTIISIVVGLLVFLLWIQMDWTVGSDGAPLGFDPTRFADDNTRILMIFFRIFGAVLVVPVMEELFWRSFLIRYIIVKDFDSVRIGTFTWGSFLITVILFGVEHSFIYAGIMAGIAYNLLLYKTRSIAHCVLSHAVTNMALAVYVIYSGKWQFW